MSLRNQVLAVISILSLTSSSVFAGPQLDEAVYQSAYQATINDIASSDEPQKRADSILTPDKKSLSEQAEVKAQELADKISTEQKLNPSKKSKILYGIRDGAYFGAAMMGACMLFQAGEEDHVDAKKCATSLAIGTVAGVGLGLIIRHFEKKHENKDTAK